jgi:starch phosphorylase
MNAPFSYASPTLSVEALKHSIAYKLMFTIGKDPVIANKHEWLNATLFAVRDRLVERWLRSNRAQLSQETRQVYYLSMEFLIGRTLSNALLSLTSLIMGISFRDSREQATLSSFIRTRTSRK